MNEAWPAACKTYGLDPQDLEMKAHFCVLMESLVIHSERAGRYRGLWKHYGWVDSLFNMRSRVARLIMEFGDTPTVELVKDISYEATEWRTDDARDLINFCVFFIRNVRDNRHGPGSITL